MISQLPHVLLCLPFLLSLATASTIHACYHLRPASSTPSKEPTCSTRARCCRFLRFSATQHDACLLRGQANFDQVKIQHLGDDLDEGLSGVAVDRSFSASRDRGRTPALKCRPPFALNRCVDVDVSGRGERAVTVFRPSAEFEHMKATLPVEIFREMERCHPKTVRRRGEGAGSAQGKKKETTTPPLKLNMRHPDRILIGKRLYKMPDPVKELKRWIEVNDKFADAKLTDEQFLALFPGLESTPA